MRRLIFVILVAMVSSVVVGQSEAGDWLLYVEPERVPAGLNAYNPTTGETLELPVFAEFYTLKMSGDGRIAYVQENDVWVLDVLNAPYDPVNISQTPDEEEFLIGWTPDSRLLEYSVGAELRYAYDGREALAVHLGEVRRYWNENDWYFAIERGDSGEVSYVWNGQERIDLDVSAAGLEDAAWYSVDWTPDNRLFFTVGDVLREPLMAIGPTAVFYWNGETVQEVERPSNDETFMVGDWSNDGRLMMYTAQGFDDHWYLWDGVSFTAEGVPDASTFIRINADDEPIGDIAWMPDGRLAIAIQGNPDKDTLLGHPFNCADPCRPTVFLWDTESMQQVVTSERLQYLVDVHDNGNFAVFEFNGINVFNVAVYDPTAQLIFQSEFRPVYSRSRWSADGLLAFCYSGISVWDGQDVTNLDTGTIEARWLLVASHQTRSPTLNCSAG